MMQCRAKCQGSAFPQPMRSATQCHTVIYPNQKPPRRQTHVALALPPISTVSSSFRNRGCYLHNYSANLLLASSWTCSSETLIILLNLKKGGINKRRVRERGRIQIPKGYFRPHLYIRRLKWKRTGRGSGACWCSASASLEFGLLISTKACFRKLCKTSFLFLSAFGDFPDHAIFFWGGFSAPEVVSEIRRADCWS